MLETLKSFEMRLTSDRRQIEFLKNWLFPVNSGRVGHKCVPVNGVLFLYETHLTSETFRLLSASKYERQS